MNGSKKWEIWNHFLARALVEDMKLFGQSQRLTGRRIGRTRALLWEDQSLWDEMRRHRLESVTPEDLEQSDPECYTHASGNFWGLVLWAASRAGIVR